jgi:hypothetical protein
VAEESLENFQLIFASSGFENHATIFLPDRLITGFPSECSLIHIGGKDVCTRGLANNAVQSCYSVTYAR